MTSKFPQPVVFEVLKHLVLDHEGDSLLIVQELGGRPEAKTAVPVDLDGGGIEFLVDEERIRIDWPEPISKRPQIRTSCIALYEQACHKRGITPRDAQGAA